MIKISERKFQMMFNDGVHVSIDAKEQTLNYKENHNSHIERYPLSLIYFSYKIDKKLPDKARTKLAYFPRFLKEMQKR